MAIVTGDRYLDSLVKFVERNAEPLIEGSLTLKLNPVGLHYVQCRLEALQELERLLAGAPVDYLRAYVSDLGDHRALEQLRRILQLLTSLKVISVLAPPSRDPTPLSLLPFGRLKVLELRGCDLSSSTARGLLELRHTLEKLICHNSTDALRHVFASRLVDIKDSPSWNKLSFVSCSSNGLILMDESLQLLPAVETLDLSRNHFAKLDNLRKCTKLSHLDLGFNHLRTIASLSEVSCPIVKLVLRNNAISKLWGIENLRSIEALDISYNLLSTFSELEILASLPSLHSVWLEGNPICSAQWYRGHFFSLFSFPEKVKLDDEGISSKECWQRRVIIAGRRKRPAGYGFYFPAKEKTEDDERSRIGATRRKVFRIASIQDEQKRGASSAEEQDKELLSRDIDNQNKENGGIQEEFEIKCLTNRAQCMKKEHSVLQSPDSRERMERLIDDSNAKPSKLTTHIKLEDSVSVGCNGSLDIVVEVGEDKDDCGRSSSFASIEEIMYSRQSSLCPMSPPHYERDMLHSRQNIENKLLQLPDETFSLTSSESDVSPSDDDSCESNDSCLEKSELFKRASMKGIIIEEHADFAQGMINPGFEDGIREKLKGDSDPQQMSCLERSSSLLDRDAQIERYFSTNLADSSVLESCRDLTCCEWISEEPGCREREVAVLLSTDQKVCVLLIDETYEGLGMISKVVGCYKFHEIKEVVVGLESQALRVRVEGGVSHIFLTRSAKKLEKLLYMFNVFDSLGCPLKCWEQIQVEFFDEYICGGLRLNIFLYAMLFLCKAGGKGWISRSLFLVEGYLFLCVEDISNFGFSAKGPYYSLDSCWPIEGVTEMVIEGEKSECVTLTMGHTLTKKRENVGTSITDCFHDRHRYDDDDHVEERWRLRWDSHDALQRFVALVKALHSELATSPIHVEVCPSSP